ncbi:hypothetical protein FQA39_LY14501 [Lamprigera yunnana]|nr:hypothetical protein FQA39_LY14501 [Lamprigera yunnana]
MERHFVLCSIPEDQQLKLLSKQLRGEAAKFWADYQYFVTGYDEFVQALFEDFPTLQARADGKAEVDSRLKKKQDKAALSVPQKETHTATPASTHAKVKYKAEPEPSQKETEVTQLNAYTTAASEMAIEKFDTTAENDNDAEDEVFVKEKRPADFNNDGPLENDHDNNTQEEEPEQTTAAEQAEIPANDADSEFDVGREEILTDEEVKHRTNPEGNEVLKKVEEEIVAKKHSNA